MKKNLLSVLILALLVVNIVMTGIMMFSVMNTNNKTAALVGNVAAVLNLELKQPGEEEEKEIPISDVKPYAIEGAMTVPLKSDDGKDHYMMFNISLSMNSKHKDYKAYGETIGEYQEQIKDTINSVVMSHTESECRDNFEELKAEILAAVQDLFKSDFIFQVAISEVKYQ